MSAENFSRLIAQEKVPLSFQELPNPAVGEKSCTIDVSDASEFIGLTKEQIRQAERAEQERTDLGR